MFHVSIRPLWTISDARGRSLGEHVVALLVQVSERGSLAAACEAVGVSYRHAWQLLREAEGLFGQPLLTMSRGRGSQLAPLGERLVWAHHRVQARLSPMLDSLSSELAAEIGKALAPDPGRLRIHASHGFAVQALKDFMDRAGLAHELKYCGGAEALEALTAGQCDVAGVHVPIGPFEAAAVAHHRRWLDPQRQRVIRLATRRQGLITRPGNPKKIFGIADLARPDVRFINRQAGSGTRFLLDLMLAEAGIDAAAVHGYEQCEFTHAAVAAFVASGMADVGMGVEVPAREFRLDFTPIQQERYFLVCHADRLESVAVQQLLAILTSADFRAAIDRLPGYAADELGQVQAIAEVLPGLLPRRTAAAGLRPGRRRGAAAAS
ncbi:MAG TPA: substrate-binding domain-containing protein [Hydrogenophaga sp.]|uniref:substrate-binding domain-containing protein n=1 Tax=Hydrogenophaga sp. TaxID=1904254 RepID=UPI002C00697A|nr:substrate-binding domain-containing protein [Hydrogenophaga sp.]HMN92774.1 substrate-binding domain-containing protein [Hydrogenophaga sp.]HMP11345.1 substrate-binding domain-containing protein [Hydrogenophaga sp.]